VATILCALVGTAPLLSGESGLLAGRLLLSGDVSLLLLGLELLRLLSRLASLLSGLLLELLGRLLLVLLCRLLLELLRWLPLGRLLSNLLGRLSGLLALLSDLLGLAGLLLALLAALAGRQELAGLGVARSLLGEFVHPLAELLRVATILCALVGTAALFTGPAGLLAGRLLLSGHEPPLLLGLLPALLTILVLSSARVSLVHGLWFPCSVTFPARVSSLAEQAGKLPTGCVPGNERTTRARPGTGRLPADSVLIAPT
jgi:hypothetical protein